VEVEVAGRGGEVDNKQEVIDNKLCSMQSATKSAKAHRVRRGQAALENRVVRPS
jgi:hypothetical protein